MDKGTDETKQVSQVDLGRAGTAVRDGVTRSLKGLNEIEAGIVTLVREPWPTRSGSPPTRRG